MDRCRTYPVTDKLGDASHITVKEVPTVRPFGTVIDAGGEIAGEGGAATSLAADVTQLEEFTPSVAATRYCTVVQSDPGVSE